MGLVPWRLDLWCRSSWILNDFFTKIKLKLYLKISEEFEKALPKS